MILIYYDNKLSKQMKGFESKNKNGPYTYVHSFFNVVFVLLSFFFPSFLF